MLTQDLGFILKQTRESKGVTLKDIEKRTNIQVRFLKYIDEGLFDKIPGEVYLKGFLRQYAKCLDLDEDDIINKYYECKAQGKNHEGHKSEPSGKGGFFQELYKSLRSIN